MAPTAIQPHMLGNSSKGFAMRKHALLAFAGLSLAYATPAAAQVALAPISYSHEFQVALEEDIGPREGEYLRTTVTRAIERALAARGVSMGGGAATIEVAIIDADPNQPTIHQTHRNLSLDSGRSVSIGGAELHAVLRGSDGQVLREINHRRYNHSISELLYPPGTWTEAHRAINQFARKVADAYVVSAR
jgi:hypothetical protein